MNKSEAVKVSVDDRNKIWKEHMEKLINVENEWSDSIDHSKVEGAVRRIDVEKVRCAMNRMKIRKASGHCGVAIKLFKSAGVKLYEVLDGCLREKVDINKMQYGFMPRERDCC